MEERKILIIEDDPDHAELILEVLDMEDSQCEIVLMSDGQEVIDYFLGTDIPARAGRSDSEDGNVRHVPFDLIILDLNLPKVNGIEILKFLKRDVRYSLIPVIILSTSSDQETISEAYRNGANGYVAKPISYEEYIEKIRSLKNYWFMTNQLPVGH